MIRFLLYTLIFTFLLTFSFDNISRAETSNQTIVGEVTLIGDNVLRIKDDTTKKVVNLWAPQSYLDDINTGYRVKVEEQEGKVVSLKVLGIPKEAEPIVVPGEPIIFRRKFE